MKLQILNFCFLHVDAMVMMKNVSLEKIKEHYELDEPVWMERFVNVVNAVDLWIQSEEKNFEYGKVCMRLITETRELNRVIFSNEDREYKLSLLHGAAEMVDTPNAPIVLDEAIHKMKNYIIYQN